MATTCTVMYFILVLVCSVGLAIAQEATTCYSPGSIAASVILTFLCTVLLVAGLYYWWKKRRSKIDNHLILETDAEKGKGEFAFDNPGFKDTSVLSTSEKPAKSKWNQWAPLAGLTGKSEKRQTLDDSALEENHPVKVVALQGHDFTGLGFNICGNIKEGIYIKDILHRGPAFESGKLSSGDRINSVTISFEHMVYEDALTILSYASPYEVIVEAKSGKLVINPQGQGAQLIHPKYRSSSCADLQYVDKSSKKRDDGSMTSNYSSLQKSKTSTATLERKDSNSTKPNGKQTPQKPKTSPKHSTPEQLRTKHLTPDQLRTQLEQRISNAHQNNLRVKEKHQKHESELPSKDVETNKHQKFGIRVLPMVENTQQLSPKIAEQNDNNINIEKQPTIRSIDEVDESNKKPQARKREKKSDANFERNEEQRSLIKRDENGIPQEIPNFMFNAALAARNNRKNSNEEKEAMKIEDEDAKTPKKLKGKAPSPPEDTLPNKSDVTDDSEAQFSSVNTIELNSNEITIHHLKEEELKEDEEKRQNRRTASTGDLSKIQKISRSANGTLERAQSLDITDAAMAILSKKEDMQSDEDLFGTAVLSKEPRLSFILDGLNTFQRNKLKKSTEWGNLEDAILKVNEEDHGVGNSSPLSNENKFEFDALVNRINEIKREDLEVLPREVVDTYVANAAKHNQEEVSEEKVQNPIWPDEEEVTEVQIFVKQKNKDKKSRSKDEDTVETNVSKRQQIPVLERTVINPPEVPIIENVLPREIKIEEERNYYTFEPKTEVLNRQRLPNDNKSSIPVPSKDWEFDLSSTSPPVSLTITEDHDVVIVEQKPPADQIKSSSEYLLSQIPGLSSVNTTDEGKTVVVFPREEHLLQNATQNFLFTEQMSCSHDKTYDTNISDDIKVSRHSQGSLDRKKDKDVVLPKSDDAKSKDINNISNVVVTENGGSNLHSLELSVNEPSELYITASESNVEKDVPRQMNDNSKVTISTPDLIKNVTLTEAISAVNDDSSKSNNSSLTYITEIQVTPNSRGEANVSEIEIVPNGSRNLETEFENYVKNFESKLERFENNIENFETNLSEFIQEEPTSIIINDNVEKEVHKIQEIAEEQLKKLPEMRFTTSSYESDVKSPEKRHSFELLRSNFEKSPPKKETTPKSRIPIATSMTSKTPPTSPERRDSKNLENENDTAAILELMSSNVVTSTPFSKIKPPSKNVTVTSIRTNSKIPSGLPMLGGGRPPIPPRKVENDDNVVQVVSTNGGTSDSSFKQWVFNPGNVTNVVVENQNNNNNNNKSK